MKVGLEGRQARLHGVGLQALPVGTRETLKSRNRRLEWDTVLGSGRPAGVQHGSEGRGFSSAGHGGQERSGTAAGPGTA